MKRRRRTKRGPAGSAGLLLVLSAALASYAAAEVWLNWGGGTLDRNRKWCEWWMCPQEFTNERIAELTRLSLAGREKEAVAELGRAVVLDSASAYNWADLGDAEVNASNLEAARYCFQRALEAGGGSPIILFRAANFEFQTGDETATLVHFRAILRNAELASYFEPAFLTMSRMDLPIGRILNEGMPNERAAAHAFLRFLMEGRKVADSEATWRWMGREGRTDDRIAGEYVQFLLREKVPEVAAEAWQEYTAREAPEYRKTNWVFDGRFDREPKLSPLDWILESSKEVQVTRVPKAGHDGSSAVQVKFAGDKNVDFRQVSQTTVLQQGVWRLRAWVRTEGITTDRGMTLHVFDSVDGTRLDLRSRDMTGTNRWTLVSTNFKVGPSTRTITIEFAREASWKFDSKIAGTAWLDSVELTPSN